MVKRANWLLIFLLATCCFLSGEDDVSILLAGNRMLITAEGRFMLNGDFLEEDAALLALAKARLASGRHAVRYILTHETISPTFNNNDEGVALISDLVSVKEESPNRIFADGHQLLSNKFVMILSVKALQERVVLIRRQPWMAWTFQIEHARNEALMTQLNLLESQEYPPGLTQLMPIVKKLKASEWVRKGMQSPNEAAQVQHFEQAVILDPDYAFARFQLGKAYVRLKAYENALKNFDAIIAQYPDWTEVYYSRSLVQGNLRNFDQVITDCSLILKQDPAFLQALVNRGIAYQQTGNPDAAMADYQKALAVDPAHVIVHYNMACIYALQGEASTALQSVESALKNGFTDFESLQQDPDLKSLQDGSEFQSLMTRYQQNGLE